MTNTQTNSCKMKASKSYSDFLRYYSYEEIRDFANYVSDNCFDIPEAENKEDTTLTIEQLGVFENLLLEAFSPIAGRNEGIKMIVCSGMIWQVIRQILNISGTQSIFCHCSNIPKLYEEIERKANFIHQLHSVIRHPTDKNIKENGWVLQREWTEEQSNLVRNIAQIIYKLVMTLRMYITLHHLEEKKING